MKNKKPNIEYSYKIYRKEFGKKILLCNCNFEDIDQFKILAKNSDYIITYNNKDITKNYR